MKHGDVVLISGAVILMGVALVTGCVMSGQKAYENVMVQMEQQTGLKMIQIPGTTNTYFGKTHRGYQVIYSAKAGNVWGRYAARLTMGEIGREVGGIMIFLTGSYTHISGNVAGSPLDRLLSRLIGQPLSVMIILKHGKPDAPRLDVLSGFANVAPEDSLPLRAKVGFKAGNIYSPNAEFARCISENKVLMKRMQNMRCEYIRVDNAAVTFFWAGSETDYSGMISDHGGYYKMVNDLMDDLADIADAISAK